MARKNYEIDMTEGPILGKMIRFALPLMLSSILQLLFNAADVIVVGRFAGSEALAAVGSTGSLINLIIAAFVEVCCPLSSNDLFSITKSANLLTVIINKKIDIFRTVLL